MYRVSHKAAFSLPELLLTAFIMAYSLSMILMTYTTTLVLNDASRNLTTATSHAQFVLETIRATSFSNIGTNVTAGTWNWNTASVTSQGLTALKSESIATTATGANPLTITVTVNWMDLRGRSRSKALKTIITG
jgi:Tfp pilus assembly protein PilV